MRASAIRRLLIRQAVPILLLALAGCGGNEELAPWHTADLSEEFRAEMAGDEVRSFDAYLALEERLFRQLDEEVYALTDSGPEHELERYSAGSVADPHRWQPNWNRSFELSHEQPVGGVLLLHGMSDSPYSLRALGESLHAEGYQVLGLRLPGHGTAPSGLRRVTWQDMAAAARLALDHLGERIGAGPLHLVGYSTGAPLALDLALEVVTQGSIPVPASLVLVSPAIRVHPASGVAGLKDMLSGLPGLDGLAYLSIMDEFDPFKYNSFATNAAAQVHDVTRSVDQRIRALSADSAAAAALPPILVLKSTVDATVTTAAVVDNLLMRLSPHRNELILFDINRRSAITSSVLVDDPAPLTDRLMADRELPFAVTFVTNEHPDSARVVAQRKEPFAAESARPERLWLAWPPGVVSLSHVALTFPPDDPLYGSQPPEDSDLVFLGNLAFSGERGLVRLPHEWLLRQRYNPFFPFLEDRVVRWMQENGDG